MDKNTFNTTEVIKAARRYRDAKQELDQHIEVSPEDIERLDELSDALFTAEEAMMEAAIERLKLVGTADQIETIEKIKHNERAIQMIAKYALS